jgi:transcriptional regulator with XRE-family HTH domain
MITPLQIRMARAGLRWTIEDLSDESGVSSRTIKRIEAADEIISANVSTLNKLKASLEAAGIEFIGTPDNDPGILILTTKPNETS